MTILLAIDPSTRGTGWAVFQHLGSPDASGGPGNGKSHSAGERGRHPASRWTLLETGPIVVQRRAGCVGLEDRVALTREHLDQVAERWRPAQVVCALPAPLQLPTQQAASEVLYAAIKGWADDHRLSLTCYQHREIRWNMLGRGHAGKEELAYLVMTRWNLLGEEKTTHEWNAIAVGDYHIHYCGATSGPDRPSSK